MTTATEPQAPQPETKTPEQLRDEFLALETSASDTELLGRHFNFKRARLLQELFHHPEDRADGHRHFKEVLATTHNYHPGASDCNANNSWFTTVLKFCTINGDSCLKLAIGTTFHLPELLECVDLTDPVHRGALEAAGKHAPQLVPYMLQRGAFSADEKDACLAGLVRILSGLSVDGWDSKPQPISSIEESIEAVLEQGGRLPADTDKTNFLPQNEMTARNRATAIRDRIEMQRELDAMRGIHTATVSLDQGDMVSTGGSTLSLPTELSGLLHRTR